MKPTGETWRLKNETNLEAFIRWVRNEWDNNHVPALQVMNSERSLSQNAMMFHCYRQVSKQTGESLGEIRRFCKLHFGVAIRKIADNEFCDWYNANVKPLPYETKLHLMEAIPITSTFTVAQAVEYIDSLIHHYANHGINVTRPE